MRSFSVAVVVTVAATFGCSGVAVAAPEGLLRRPQRRQHRQHV